MKRYLYLTPVSLIFLVTIVMISSCCHKVVSRENINNKTSSSLVRKTIKDVELMELPFQVNSGSKTYFSYEEVITYYNTNYTPNEVNQFITLRNDKLHLLQEQIDRRNIERYPGTGYTPESIDDYPLFYFNKSFCEAGRDLITHVRCINDLKKTILHDLHDVRKAPKKE